MEHTARWIRRHGGDGCLYVLNVVFAAYAVIGFVIALFLALVDGEALERLIALGLFQLAVVLNVPILIRKRKRRNRLSLQTLVLAAGQGKLAESIGPNAPALEEAAADLEQTEALIDWTTLDKPFAKAIRRVGNERMRRMIELTVAAPARYGLTRAQAEVQFQEDARWLAEARRLVERLREAPATAEADDTLTNLRAHVEAREEAFIELTA